MGFSHGTSGYDGTNGSPLFGFAHRHIQAIGNGGRHLSLMPVPSGVYIRKDTCFLLQKAKRMKGNKGILLPDASGYFRDKTFPTILN